jgi:hypothetical protein
MNKKMALSLFLGSAVSIVMLYLAFRNIPFKELGIYLQSIDYQWIVPTIGLVILTFILRTMRWQIILKGAGNITFWQAFHPLMIGFMMNCTLPGRIGEIARPVLLKKQQKIPLTTGLATVATERLIDVLFLLLLFMAVFSKFSSQPGAKVTFGDYSLDSETLHLIARSLIKLGIALLLLILFLAIPRTRAIIAQKLETVVHWKMFSGPSKIKQLSVKTLLFISAMLENISAGVSLILYPGRLAACLLLSAVIWGLTVATYMVLAKGFPGIMLTAWDWTTVMVVVCFFIALPSVPGFWGLWEAGGIFALSLYGIQAKEAAGITLVNHATQMLPVILVGFCSAALTSVNILRVVDEKDNLAIVN